MEFLFELLLELIFEGTFEVCKNKRTPKCIRYPLIGLIVLLFLGVASLIFFTGVLAYQRLNRVCGALLIVVGGIFCVAGIAKLRKAYLLRVAERDLAHESEEPSGDHDCHRGNHIHNDGAHDD